MQIVAVFPLVFREGLTANAAKLSLRVPLSQLTVFQRLKELGDIPRRPAESWIAGWKVGLLDSLELVPGMIVFRIVVVDETSLQIHHLGNEPFPVFQGGMDARLDVGKRNFGSVGENGLTMLLPVARIAIQVLKQNIPCFISHIGIPPYELWCKKATPVGFQQLLLGIIWGSYFIPSTLVYYS